MTYLPRVTVKLTKECVCENITVRRRSVREVKDAVNLFNESLLESDREKLICIHLDSSHKVLAFEVVSVGSLNSSIVHPREVFKAAILLNAHSILIMHNHPSGDPTPSAEDVEITRKLKEVGDLLSIPLVDHVIVASTGHCSFAEKGML